MPFVQGTSLMGQLLSQMGQSQMIFEESCPAQTVLLPDIHLHEMHHMMKLLHKVRAKVGLIVVQYFEI